MDIYQITGIAGAGIYLGAYALLQLGYVRGDSVAYAMMNILAASCVLVSMFSAFNVGSAIIQVSFIALSAISVIRFSILKIPPRVTHDDRELAQNLLPDLPLRRAMSILNAGTWENAKTGTLTIENQDVDQLYFLARGSADVMHNDQVVTKIENNQVIGDMAILTGNQAAATVTLTKPSKVYSINASIIHKELQKSDDVRMCFQRKALHILADRLKATNGSAITG